MKPQLLAFLVALITIARADTVSYWRFEEGSGTTVADETGLANGTLNNSNNWQAEVASPQVPQTGQTNRYSFGMGNWGGSMTFMTASPKTNFNLGPNFTFEVYGKNVWPNSHVNDSFPLGVFGDKFFLNGSTHYADPTKLYFSGGGSFLTSDPIGPGDWSHIAFVANGKVGRFYLNGVQAGARLMNAMQFSFTTNDVYSFGQRGNTLSGLLDEIRLSNTALKPWQFLNANPPPAFEITSISRQGDDVSLAWPGFGGTINHVQASGAMNGTFSDIAAPIVVLGDSVTTITFTDTGGATNSSTRFYRISMITPQAIDDASSYNGWSDGTASGNGLAPWALTATTDIGGASNGFFTASSINNAFGTSPGIDTAGKAWGVYANSGNYTAAYRVFASAIPVGGTFNISMDNGLVDPGNSVGFVLRNGIASSAPSDYNIGARFEFLFLGGGSSYAVVDAAGYRTIGLPFTGTGLWLSFTLNTADSYTLLAIDNASGATNTVTGTLADSGSLDSVALYNRNAGSGGDHDAFFNSLQILGP